MTLSPSAAPRMFIIFALALAGATSSFASTILGGVEDLNFTAGSDHDYNDMIFQMTGSLSLAGLAGTNVLGWYDPDHPEDRHVIFSGAASAGAVVAFTPSSRFVLYLETGAGQTFASRASGNMGESGTAQHFAFFESGGLGTP